MAKLRSQPLFWKDGHKDDPALDIQGALDYFSSIRGVGCDGIINGVLLQTPGVGEPTDPLKLSVETISGITYIVLRKCDGTLVQSWSATSDPQAVSKVYRAPLTGSNGAIVGSPTVQKNTLSAAIAWAYSAEGVYTGTLAAAFTADKTSILVSNLDATGGVILTAVWTSANVITISTFAVDGTTPADFIGHIQVEIIVDP